MTVETKRSGQDPAGKQPADGSPSATPGTASLERQRFLRHLYEQHFGELTGRLRRLYGSGPPEPEDLAQTAFAKVAEIEDIERIKHPRAFLFRTAINLGLNAIQRSNTARRFIERELLEADAPLMEENSPEDVYSIQQRMTLAARAIDALTPKQKEIVVRSCLKGQTYAVISRETGWSQADISRQMTAALAAMQANLAASS